MIHMLKNTSVRELIKALEHDGSDTKDAKAAKGSIATLMDVELSYIIIMRRIPYLPVLLKVFSTELNGAKMISNASG